MRSVAVVLSLALLGCSATGPTTSSELGSTGGAKVAETKFPKVFGPITGGQYGRPFNGYFGDIAARGYVEEEYFLEGNASAFEFASEFSPDGRWTLKKTVARPYKTRILVRRPRDPAKFNGSVVVEWTNVSNGYDNAFADPPGVYEGFAYVAVSAQRVGVHGFEKDPRGTNKPPMGLLQWDPERYGSLSHPGDSLSYDIFTQAGRSVGPNRELTGVDPMGGLKVKKLIAVGGSQSGSRLAAYTNGVQPIEGVFDALMPLVNGGNAAHWTDGLPNDPKVQAGPKQSGFTKIRDDLNVKVFSINSETEAAYYVQVRQDDTDRFRYWEVAGASHGGTGQIQLIRQKTERDGVGGPGGGGAHVSDVLWLPTFGAAIYHVHRWITEGVAPPIRPKLEVEEPGAPAKFKRDKYGNALGGVRLPEIEVPIARYAASTPESRLLGETFPFDAKQLAKLYPTNSAYVAKVKAAAKSAVKAGVILPYRAKEYAQAAKDSRVPKVPAPPKGATKVTGPITGGQHGWPFGGSVTDLSKVGYVEEEFFLEGQATRFEPVGELGLDGKWTIKPTTSDRYKTRLLVHRPREAANFNGTVIVVWTNVSAGFEISGTPERYDGFAYVAMSAQPTGLIGFKSTRLGLVNWDSERYGTLTIPDEGLSYDIFTQAARAIGPKRSRDGSDPMGGLPVKKLVAVGASQSCTRVMAYLNGVQPRERVFDAFMPTICAGTAGDFNSEMAHPDPADVTERHAKLTGAEKDSPQGALAGAARRGHSRAVPSKVRDDLQVPVLALNTETEAFVYFPRRQPETDRFRYWEVAGAAHAGGSRDRKAWEALMERDGVRNVRQQRTPSLNTRSQVNWQRVYEAALHHVHNWITTGKAPPKQPLMEISGAPPSIQRDANGNARGGIRLPELEVPVASYRGMDENGSIGGSTSLFSPEKLRELYKDDDDYARRVADAAHAAVKAGVLLPDRADEYIQEARAAKPLTTPRDEVQTAVAAPPEAKAQALATASSGAFSVQTTPISVIAKDDRARAVLEQVLPKLAGRYDMIGSMTLAELAPRSRGYIDDAKLTEVQEGFDKLK